MIKTINLKLGELYYMTDDSMVLILDEAIGNNTWNLNREFLHCRLYSNNKLEITWASIFGNSRVCPEEDLNELGLNKEEIYNYLLANREE